LRLQELTSLDGFCFNKFVVNMILDVLKNTVDENRINRLEDFQCR
jgi:hypothetical protein